MAGVGQLGGAIAVRLLEAGHQLVGVNRSGQTRVSGLPMIAADLTATAPLSLPQADNLVIVLSPASRDPEVYRKTYVEGVRKVLKSLPEPPGKLLFVSSTVVYPVDDGSWVDHSSSCSGHNLRAQVQLEAEALAVAGADASVLLRLGGIYGPGREMLIRRVRSGAPLVESPPNYTNRITEHDAARLVVHLLAQQNTAGIYLGVDHQPTPMHEVCQWLAAQLGLKPLPVDPNGSDDERAAKGKRISNRRVLESGFQFDFPTYREGYGALLADSNSAH